MAAQVKPGLPLLNLLTWQQWLGIVLVLLLVGLLGFLVWRRLRKDGAAPPAMPAAPPMPANHLVKVWQRFESGVPLLMRREALGAPLFVVLGEAGAGKTAIIDRYVQWQGQNYRFRPSETDDPLLQVYLGPKALALELAAALLYDTSAAAYRALRRLWRHLPSTPQVVAVVDAANLLDPQPERLRQIGQALFGKLEVFSELEGGRLPLTLVLSHMDRVEGYVEFCAFLEKSGIPLRSEFPDGDGAGRLTACLAGYEPHLSRALVACPAQEFLKIVRFLDEAPRLLGALDEFLRLAGLEQGALPAPVVRLCLLSEQVHAHGGQPFLPLSSELPREPWLPVKLGGHAKAALALTLAGLVYLIGSYRYEQAMLSDLVKKLDLVRITPLEHYAERVSPLFLDFSASLRRNPELSLMPDYFPAVGDEARLRLIRDIRKYYLFPKLKQYQFEPDAPFKTNRMLGLLYATEDNKLGELILGKLATDPTDDMMLYRTLVQDYIANNSHTEELDAVLNSFDYAQAAPGRVEDNMPWLMLFRDLQQMLKRPYIRGEELAQVQRKASQLLKIVNRVIFYRYQPEIVQWLEHNTGLQRAIHTEYYSETQLRQQGIAELLGFVAHLRLSDDETCTPGVPLSQCLNEVQAVAQAKPDAAAKTMAFALEGENFAFDAADWSSLITRSRIVLMLRNIARAHKAVDGWAFFEFSSPFPDVEMNGANEGGGIFSGKARIDGRLTAEAFQQQVKPAVLALDTIVAKLPIAADERKRFADFVHANLRVYIDRYVGAYADYFRQLQVHIDSAWALKATLEQLQQPNSPVLQALVQVKVNTAPDVTGSAAFQPFAERLAVFRFVQRLMQEQGGAYPEFGKYLALMQQMQAELESQEPYAGKKSDEAAGLKKALSPMARLGWSMMLNDESSYLRLTKAWLQNAAIADDWQQPFLAPVLKVAELGKVEVKQSVDGIWNDLWTTGVQPLLLKFPFAPEAGRDREITVDELNQMLHPKQGFFWNTFRDYLAPLCRYANGAWGQRNELIGSLALPDGMLRRLNAAQKFSEALWDEQGNAKPLPIAARPEPLPTFSREQVPDAPLVSLGYLRAGGASVLGFNQQPAWQKFPMAWNTPQPAAVGLEFRKEEEAIRTYADISVNESPWNFYRLLQKGQALNGNRYAWSLVHPDYPQQKLDAQFSFQADPWALFTSLAGS